MAKGLTMKQANFDLSRVPGWRENRDLIDAAIAQGWTYRLSKGGSHLRLTPPDPDKDQVTIGGTPSDFRSRRNVISQLRQNGLIWPWPPQPKARDNDGPEPVQEQWAPVLECSVAEVSNGGKVRKTADHKPIKPDHKRIVVLTDDKGNVRSFSVPLLVRAVFGHAPLPNVIPAPEAKEADMVAETPSVERWEPVLIEGIAEGYEVNAQAKVLPPKNARLRERKPLVPMMRGGRLVVSLKPVGKPGYRQVALDEIVLEAFEARPSINHYPKHCDNNPENCALDNLVWVEHERTKAEAIKEHEVRLSQKVATAATVKPASGLVLAYLDLPPRTHGMLKRKGITTVEGLTSLTERDLWDKGLTSLGIDAVKSRLATRSLSLRSAEDEIVTTPVVTPKVDETDTAPEPQEAPIPEPVEEKPVTEPEKPKKAAVKVHPMGKLSEVVVTRVYTNPVTGLAISVDADGQAALPEGRLTAGQLTALSHIIMAITEDNDKLGAQE